MNHRHLVTFGGVCVVAWALGTFLFIAFWPHLAYNTYQKAIVAKGFGGGPIPVNTLYTEPQALFADPLHASYSGSKLAVTGVNRDTLYVMGWLDLRKGPQVLQVPDIHGRYYSVQFTDPAKNINFAYVGKRTTGTQAGDYLIAGPAGKEPYRKE